MARVCPRCRKFTSDDELFCLNCATATVKPTDWKQIRPSTPEQRDRPKYISPQTASELSDTWLKMGLGGMLAFFLFFLIYLACYFVFFG